jgi:hypothetical protein
MNISIFYNYIYYYSVILIVANTFDGESESDGDEPFTCTLVNTISFDIKLVFDDHIKGCDIIVEIAKRLVDVEFILCGQGYSTKYLIQTNIKYKI